jgi:hypothetical protein
VSAASVPVAKTSAPSGDAPSLEPAVSVLTSALLVSAQIYTTRLLLHIKHGCAHM